MHVSAIRFLLHRQSEEDSLITADEGGLEQHAQDSGYYLFPVNGPSERITPAKTTIGG